MRFHATNVLHKYIYTALWFTHRSNTFFVYFVDLYAHVFVKRIDTGGFGEQN